MDTIGRIIATEKQPSTIEEFTFWTRKDLKLKPFDVVVVEHVKDAEGNDSLTFGVVGNLAYDGFPQRVGWLYFQRFW